MSLLVNRLHELAQKAYTYNMPIFSDFLDLADIQLAKQCGLEKNSVIVRYSNLFYQDERQIVGFFPSDYDMMSEAELLKVFPIDIFLLSPSFDTVIDFNHRDLLGSVMGLNIERKLIGDILVYDTNAYLQCHQRISQLVYTELILVRQQSVGIKRVEQLSVAQLKPRCNELDTTVASLRLDGIIKAICHQSRTTAASIIQRGHVKVNQIEVTKIHRLLESGDLLSIKGYGKYKVISTNPSAKSSRIRITYLQYI